MSRTEAFNGTKIQFCQFNRNVGRHFRCARADMAQCPAIFVRGEAGSHPWLRLHQPPSQSQSNASTSSVP
jgi:hypothetical protein